MLMGTRLLPAARRFAAGFDVCRGEVRLAVLSRRTRRPGPVRVEWLAAVPVAVGALAGGRIVDRAAVASALVEAFGAWPQAHAVRALSCAMAVPGSMTVTTSIELSHALRQAGATPRHALDAFEPAAYEAAERVAGIERHALAVDWFVAEAGDARAYATEPEALHGGARLTVAAAAREHLDARVEVAAAAGIVLSAVDGEPLAALRALRHAARQELETREGCAAIWFGDDGVYGWRIEDDAIEAHMRYPAPEYADLAAALRGLGGGRMLGGALVGGELERLGSQGLRLADIGDLLACTVLPFACAPFCGDATAVPARWRDAPTFAVAFGLALRGVIE